MSAWPSPPRPGPWASWLRSSVWRYRNGHYLFSSTLGLGELRGRDRLRTSEVGVVRVVLVPAAELPWFQAHAGVALPPPGLLGLAVEHAVADGPGHCDLAFKPLTSTFTPQRARQAVPVFVGSGHAFLQA